MKLTTATLTLTLAAAVAVAHEGVQNEAVKIRMDNMVDIKDATGVLGQMAQGKIAFDASAAADAKVQLAAAAALIAPQFEPEEDDPKSEARAAIWANWDDFAAKAGALEAATDALDPSSLETLQAGFRAIGGACGDCHKTYRD